MSCFETGRPAEPRPPPPPEQKPPVCKEGQLRTLGLIPRYCPSITFWENSIYDLSSPVFVSRGETIDDVIQELIVMSGGSKNVADYLEMLWNNLAITYPRNLTQMKYKEFAMVLP